MSVIFDALQQSERLTNEVKKPAIAEGIVTDDGVQKKTIIISFITFLLVAALGWGLYSSIDSSLPPAEVSLAPDGQAPSVLVPLKTQQVAVVDSQIRVSPVDEKPITKPEPVAITQKPTLVPSVFIVKREQPVAAVVPIQEKLVASPEKVLMRQPDFKTVTSNSAVVAKKERPNTVVDAKAVEKGASHENVGVLVGQIKSAIRSGNTEKLNGLFSSLEKQTSSDSTILLRLRGYAMLKQDNNVEAKSLYEGLLHQHPDDLEANLNMALLEVRLGQASQAVARLHRLSSLYPESKEVAKYLKALEVRS